MWICTEWRSFSPARPQPSEEITSLTFLVISIYCLNHANTFEHTYKLHQSNSCTGHPDYWCLINDLILQEEITSLILL